VAGLLALPPRGAATCAPAATGIFPASGLAGSSITATIVGTGLTGGTLTIYGEPGLTATVQSSMDTALTVRLDLAAAAAPGERIISLDTPGGRTGLSFVINAAGGPVVDTVSPPLIATLGQALAATVSGANLGGVTAAGVTVSGAGVSVSSATPNADGTTLAITFVVDAAADLGTHAVTLTSPGGSAVLQLYVQRPAPTIAAVAPAAAEVGATVAVTLTGTNLLGAALVISGSGVTVGGVATPDDATLTATLTIDAGATASSTEARLLIVTTESGQTTAEFFVVAAGVLTVTGVVPGAGEPGQTVPVTLKGLHLTGADVTEASPDLTLNAKSVVDDQTLTLNVVISDTAATRTDWTLTVTGPAGSTGVTFRVLAPGDPFIGSLSPPFGNRGSTITLVVHGVNLALVVPGTGIDISGPKISESNATAVDNQTARATVAIDSTANVGYRDVGVTVTSPNPPALRGSAFRVNVPGQVPTIDDVSPGLVPPGATTAMQVTGSNFAGGAVLVTGPGAVVTNPFVNGAGTLITFDLTLAANAPAENRSVIVVTANGIARCGISTNPDPPALLAARLVKPGAVFTVTSPGFRLFVFEFSLSELFTPGPRTRAVVDADGSLTLSRLQDVDIGRAFRQRHRGFVRVRAVTATNQIGISPAQAIRR
jgi:hypothetical protein